MRRTTLLLLVTLLFGNVAACSSADERAAELYSIAELEEQQQSIEHAVQLYGEVIQKYPESSWADQARARVELLEDRRAR